MDQDTADNERSPSPVQQRMKYVKSKLKKHLTASLVLPVVLHVIMVILGVVNLRNCPVEKNIPIYLVVAGILGLATKVVGISRHYFVRFMSFETIVSIIYTLEIAYLFLGSYWVFKEFKPSFDPSAGNHYCDKTSFIFAFVYITMMYFAIAFFCILVCCCFVAFAGSADIEVGYSETSTNSDTPAPMENL